jgi:hypothetical protein
MAYAGKAALLMFGALTGAALAPASAAVLAQPGAADVVLAPHRAVYDLKLSHSRNSRGAEAVSGRILYDFSGSRCEGYALQFRHVSEFSTGEGKTAVSDLRVTTWEDATAGTYRFRSLNLLDERPVEAVDGLAERGAGGVAVNLTQPATKKFQIDAGMVFPTEHMRRILIAAREEKTLLELPVYDGAENGEKIFNTLSVIGRPIAPTERVPTDAAAGQAALAGMTRWPVTVSYYDKQAKGGEQVPDYSISFEVYENGISRALVLDYNDFVLKGEMSLLEIKDSKPCE